MRRLAGKHGILCVSEINMMVSYRPKQRHQPGGAEQVLVRVLVNFSGCLPPVFCIRIPYSVSRILFRCRMYVCVVETKTNEIFRNDAVLWTK